LKSKKNFTVFAWCVLGYNLLVIAWGAYVRATGSGAGCGAHWPLCNGVVIPRAPQIETLVEFSHRLSSGLSLILVTLLVIWAYRAYEKGNRTRTAATLALVFTLTEAAVGAGLVLFELVAEDTSIQRVYSIVIHLLNTYLLLAALTLTAWWAARGAPKKLIWPGYPGLALVIGLAGLLVLGASGAITALGDTLFPSASVAAGVQEDFSPTAHFLIRLRIWHPIIAVINGIYLFVLIWWLRRKIGIRESVRLANLLLILFGLQLVLGATNILLLAPVWLQMIHLVTSDLIWICLILTAEYWFSHRIAFERPADHGIEIGIERGTSQET
jgi:heme A synthase